MSSKAKHLFVPPEKRSFRRLLNGDPPAVEFSPEFGSYGIIFLKLKRIGFTADIAGFKFTFISDPLADSIGCVACFEALYSISFCSLSLRFMLTTVFLAIYLSSCVIGSLISSGPRPIGISLPQKRHSPRTTEHPPLPSS